MRRELEEDLWRSIRVIGKQGGTPREWIRQAISDGRINSHKQAIATLRKWGHWYEYGVAEDLGWRLTGGPLPTRCACGRWTDSRVNDRVMCRPCLGRALMRAVGMPNPPAMPPVTEDDLWDECVKRSLEKSSVGGTST